MSVKDFNIKSQMHLNINGGLCRRVRKEALEEELWCRELMMELAEKLAKQIVLAWRKPVLSLVSLDCGTGCSCVHDPALALIQVARRSGQDGKDAKVVRKIRGTLNLPEDAGAAGVELPASPTKGKVGRGRAYTGA